MSLASVVRDKTTAVQDDYVKPSTTSGQRSRLQATYQLLALLCLVGCQAFAGTDSVATIGTDLTMYVSESESIRAAATAEQNRAVETLFAASTRIAEHSAVNAALGATLRANHTQTPEVQPVVVSAEDLGSSLIDDMMDDEGETLSTDATNQVSNLATAGGVDLNSGCSSGTTRQFSQTAERIYVTARVSGLRAGSNFSVAWSLEESTLYGVSWQADYSRAFECIWFYATPFDFAFLPGVYTATLHVDGAAVGSTEFAIGDS